jgi:phage terminase large subunit
MKLILKLLAEKRKALVVREVYDTLRESCFDLLLEVIDDMGLDNYCKHTVSPLSISFRNGSKIIFKGMDKPTKLKSLNNVTIVWLEEAPEIKYLGYKELIGRLRHPTLPLFRILSSNPAPKSNWLYKHFFEFKQISDKELYEKRQLVNDKTFYHHSVADDNLFLPSSYIEDLDDMKNYDPDLYRVARLGQFGTNGIIVLPQFEVMAHNKVMEQVNRQSIRRVGMDFGFVTSYNAVLRMAVDDINKYLYIYYEYYSKGRTDDQIAEDLIEFARSGERMYADSAEPKTISYLKQQGFNITGAPKPPGSRVQNTKKVKRFRKIICSDACENTIAELKELTYKQDKDGNIIEDEFEIDPHTFSAIWYGLHGYNVSDLKGSFATV